MTLPLLTAHDHGPGLHPAEIVPYLTGAIAVGLYVWGWRRRRQDPPAWAETAAWGALAAYLLAISPFFHRFGEAAFAWHMAQHLIFTMVVPPLVVLSRPRAPLASAMAGFGVRRFPGARLIDPGWSLIVATAVAVVVMWAWHLPSLYDSAVRSPIVHGVEHATMLASSMWLWWLALSRRTSHQAGILALLVLAVAGGLLGALLTFADRPLYGSHLSVADPLSDQQLAGLLMWVPGGAIPLVAATLLAVDWLRSSEKRTELRERARLRLAASAVPLLMGVALAGAVVACGAPAPTGDAGLDGADASRAPSVMAQNGCGACHSITGVEGATSGVAPPLDGFASRRFIAGTLTNTPENLRIWLSDPDAVRPGTPMPDPELTDEEARDIAAYLSQLEH